MNNHNSLLHVFCIHSTITAGMARAIIAYEHLQPENVIILSGRGQLFESHLASQIIDLDNHYINQIRITPGRRFWRSRLNIKLFDQQLRQILQEQYFHVYIPHVYSQALQLLITHPDCTGFSYIEEGLASYRTPEDLDKHPQKWAVYSPSQSRIIDRLNTLDRLANGSFYREGCISAYGLNKATFKNFNMPTVVVPFPWTVNAQLKHKYDNSSILVLDCISADFVVSKEEYWTALLYVLQILYHSNFERIFVRFNPMQSSDEQQFLSELMLQNLGDRLQFCDRNEELEAICASAQVSIITLNSSIGIYAYIMQRPVYTFASILSEISAEYAKSYAEILSGLSIELPMRDIRELKS
ncbi:MAG: hypothetical protein F6K50_23590 [Moorea sp. SIO3I7]|nr:hypothetical protein [Moorena sp. SIO3I7]